MLIKIKNAEVKFYSVLGKPTYLNYSFLVAFFLVIFVKLKLLGWKFREKFKRDPRFKSLNNCVSLDNTLRLQTHFITFNILFAATMKTFFKPWQKTKTHDLI